MIQRSIQKKILQTLQTEQKVILLFGPRQVGKTTLIKQLLAGQSGSYLVLNGDQLTHHELFASRDLDKLKLFLAGYDILFVDEAQRFRDIGLTLKILHDQLPSLKILVCGSSALELANQIKEPLTGRTRSFTLWPLSLPELAVTQTRYTLSAQIESFLLYGLYPEVYTLPTVEQKVEHLHELTSAYLYKDILQLTSIRHAHKVHKLVKLLALQVGSLVSIHELSLALELSHDTVINYIDLLEKGFIVFRLTGFSRNLRKEISKMDKIYFYDVGIRNTVIDQFQPLTHRKDIGALWENFLVAERLKSHAARQQRVQPYFWRTYTGAELDYVEEYQGILHGYEFKYQAKPHRTPKTWTDQYSPATAEQVNRDNFWEFVGM